MLEVANIEVLYGNGLIIAVRGVSLKVEQGEIVTLLGANGAGKSTVLKAICGLIDDQPEKGTIKFEGENIERRDAEKVFAKGISLVPEGREVFPELTVRENLIMGAYQRKDRAGIAADLERVYGYFPVLADRKKQDAGTLSGGEQQMLAIGRGLMARPKLLILDEPSLGLAPILVDQIFEILTGINKEGTTILLVEQNAAKALKFAHRGYIMETGRIVLSDTCDELAANKDVAEFYLGMGDSGVKGYKRYKRKKRWQ
jgi:branched-chain amino acid transport system ATP-binding protein